MFLVFIPIGKNHTHSVPSGVKYLKRGGRYNVCSGSAQGHMTCRLWGEGLPVKRMMSVDRLAAKQNVWRKIVSDLLFLQVGPRASGVEIVLPRIHTLSAFPDSKFCLCVWLRSSEFSFSNG